MFYAPPMVEDLTPDRVRDRRFDVSLRGYERDQVDSFLAGVADRIEELERSLAQLQSGGLAVGLEDRAALAAELSTIGDDVAEILETARSAAEGIRRRATVDAETWTAEARAESEAIRSEARDQSHAARASAWKEGTAMLASASAEVAAMLETAREEALFVRAEAEREALRLTGDARRDRDEMLRAARSEGEAIIEQARMDSEGVLAAANQQAEQAQERARALEQRRGELLAELEAARASISDVEQEIETKRQALEAPPEPEQEIERSHHGDDGGSVRIVAPSAVVPLRPVDAEELVAEVTALRSAPATPPVEPPDATVEAPGDTTAGDAPEAPAPVVLAAAPEIEPSTEPPADPTDVAAELPATTGPPAPVTPEPPAPPVEAEDEPSIDAASRPEEEVAPGATGPAPVDVDEIGSLFARLRSTDPVDIGEAEGDSPAGAAPEPTAPATPTPGDDAAPEATAETPTPAPPSAPDPSPVAAGADATIIPLQNAALRAIKRSLVELQNETLEHLRTDGEWTPDEAFTDRFRAPFAELSEALGGTGDDAAGRAFGADLYDAVTSAIERSRSAGAGEREVAAAASKVFRMWRSDEAEQRVIETAHTASRAVNLPVP